MFDLYYRTVTGGNGLSRDACQDNGPTFLIEGCKKTFSAGGGSHIRNLCPAYLKLHASDGGLRIGECYIRAVTELEAHHEL
jgi:hypothetical protein